jgi:hypothetical protein
VLPLPTELEASFPIPIKANSSKRKGKAKMTPLYSVSLPVDGGRKYTSFIASGSSPSKRSQLLQFPSSFPGLPSILLEDITEALCPADSTAEPEDSTAAREEDHDDVSLVSRQALFSGQLTDCLSLSQDVFVMDEDMLLSGR